MRKRVLLALLLPIVTAILAVNRTPNLGYIPPFVVATLGTELLIVRLKRYENALMLFALALTTVWAVTMWGDYLIGVDVHTEYELASRVIKNGWDASYANGNNTSLVLSLIAPALSHVIPLIWQFKALYPLVFATMPVFLYLAYERQFGHTVAWLAALYLITMPMYAFETTSMVKSMVGQTFLAVVIYFLSVRHGLWGTVLMVVSGLIAGLSHYAVAAIMSMYLLVIGLVGPFLPWKRKSPRVLIVVALLVMAGNLVWFWNVGNGAMVATVKAVVGNLASAGAAVASGNSTALVEQYTERTKPAETEGKSYLNAQEETIRAAIGLDFWEVSPLGKAFRLVQFAVEIALFTGLGVIIVKKFRTRAGYVAGMVAGVVLLIACVFVPFLSTTASASRFYQLSLLFTSPAIIIGFQFLLGTTGKGIKALWRSLLSHSS